LLQQFQCNRKSKLATSRDRIASETFLRYRGFDLLSRRRWIFRFSILLLFLLNMQIDITRYY